MKGIHNIANVSTEDRREIVRRHILGSLEANYSWKFLDSYPSSLLATTRQVHLVVDYDVDGLTAGAILYQYLDERGIDVSVRTFSRTEGFAVREEDLKKDRLNIILDRGSPEIASGIYDGYDVLIIDHHGFSAEPKGNVILVNPRTEHVEKYPCTSLIVHRLFGTQKNLPLALLGALGDVCVLDKDTHDMLYYSWPTETPWGKFASPQDVRFRIVPKLNSCGRLGKTEMAWRFLISPSKKLWTSITRVDRQRKEECAKIQPLKVIRLPYVTFALFPKQAAGHISYLAQRILGSSGIGIAAYFDEPTAGYRVSLRCNRPVLGDLYHYQKFRIGGHASAGGGYVGFQHIRDFLVLANETYQKAISDIPEGYPLLHPSDLQEEEVITALEQVSLNPPTTFQGSEEWLHVPNVANPSRRKPTYHLGTLHWGFPHGNRILAVHSFQRQVSLRWLY